MLISLVSNEVLNVLLTVNSRWVHEFQNGMRILLVTDIVQYVYSLKYHILYLSFILGCRILMFLKITQALGILLTRGLRLSIRLLVSEIYNPWCKSIYSFCYTWILLPYYSTFLHCYFREVFQITHSENLWCCINIIKILPGTFLHFTTKFKLLINTVLQ